MNTPTYKPNTLAFLDSFGGLIPCKVVSVNKGGPFVGWLGSQPEISVKITATRNGYRKGEILRNQSARSVVPLSHIVRRGSRYWIRTNYQWMD